MKMYDIIHKKREGDQLNAAELDFWLRGACAGSIPDYQSAALLMAIYFRGLNREETLDLTLAMRDSGTVLNLRSAGGLTADKHSTGGVGDKISLITAPLAAAAGLTVAKMSGRGLGYTGGTLDKLESIPGFGVELSQQEFLAQARRIGLAIIGQTAELAPADKLLYALRDVTDTVDNPALIASSIMSKKLAVGANLLVLDVKFGSGAFMKNSELAREVARIMVDIGRGAGQKVSALLSSMEQPLGRAVGNALEVREALEVLQGEGPADVRELALVLTAELLLLGGLAVGRNEGIEKATALLDSGAALAKFREMVAAQGGDTDFSRLPQAALQTNFTARAEGYIYSIDCAQVGLAAVALGAGRSVKDERIDLSAGLVFARKTGDYVRPGQVIAELHGGKEESLAAAAELLAGAVIIAKQKPVPQPLIFPLDN